MMPLATFLLNTLHSQERKIMKKVTLIFLPFVLLLACAAGVSYYKFAEPVSDDSMLVVGRIIVEDNQFSGRFQVVKSGIEVAILGQPEGSPNVTGLWAHTDNSGYFALANVPKGNYALKGIRFTLSTGVRVTLVNPLIRDLDYFRFNPMENILIEGNYFRLKPVGRVLSLQHNLFRLNPKNSSYALENDTVAAVNNYKLVDGSTLNDSLVEEYFINKYPDTVWRDDLLASIKVLLKSH